MEKTHIKYREDEIFISTIVSKSLSKLDWKDEKLMFNVKS